MTQRSFFKKSFNVSCETMKKFDVYKSLINECQKKFNLVSNNSIEEIWLRHFSDSAQTFKNISHNFFRNQKKDAIIDIGSGAGFPGMVISLMAENEKKHYNVTLVESNKKKFKFLYMLSKELDLNVNLVNDRSENLGDRHFDIITARAVAPLEKLIKQIYFANKNPGYILPKGKSWRKEIESIKNKWHFEQFIVRNNVCIDISGGVNILLKNLRFYA